MIDLTQWNFIKSHTITHPSGINDEYQIKIVAYKGRGTSNNSTVYLNERCKSDFSDIRFTDSNYNLLAESIIHYSILFRNDVSYIRNDNIIDKKKPLVVIFY